MPKLLLYILVVALIALLIPPAVIASMRSTIKKKPRIHYILDMDNQHRFKAQQVNDLFLDGRAMREPVDGTVARGELNEDTHYYKGVADNGWATTFPSQVVIDAQFIERGREQFNIFCLPCHGEAGFGDGIIHERAFKLVIAGINGTQWVQPKSVHDKTVREQPVGQTYNTITNGVRTMAGYGAQILDDDRWAIVAYVKALQRSQHALESDLPAGLSISDLAIEKLPELPASEEQTTTNEPTPIETPDGAQQP